ncbi:hypothetical protein quinque_009773 [Culex quinquefasciatus]
MAALNPLPPGDPPDGNAGPSGTNKEAVCFNCSLQHTVEPSEGGRCILDPYCKHCKGAHPATSKECPKYKKEVAIIKIQVETGVTFAEARREYEKRNQAHGLPTHAEVVGAQKDWKPLVKDNEKDNEIRLLKEEIEKLKNTAMDKNKDEVITSLRENCRTTSAPSPEKNPRRGRGRPRKTPTLEPGKFDAEMHST